MTAEMAEMEALAQQAVAGGGAVAVARPGEVVDYVHGVTRSSDEPTNSTDSTLRVPFVYYS
jgi:hypothetical protein